MSSGENWKSLQYTVLKSHDVVLKKTSCEIHGDGGP